ncbi:MAG: phenylalanine--tRNA ligase subunit alpha [SAR324 cluster bacterium]|nr:phenylalanine--tRNA ligase subunit alpha [SAR324 cluster bacterium]
MENKGSMLESLNALEKEGLDALKALAQAEELPVWYRTYLGRKGRLTDVLRGLGVLSAEERPHAGRRANEIKTALESAFETRQDELRAAEMEASLASGALDVTLPGRPVAPGHLHLSTRMLRRIRAIFAEMGFQVYEAPEVETDENNFELLNIPPYHPARDMWDTFWVGDGVVLRTHTSPGQIRCMRESHPNPIRVILPGKCYRYEQITPRSEHQFYQVEGLAVGHRIRVTDLIGTMHEFARKLYGGERRLRVRSSYFPFTEPSIEIDMDCALCGGKGCRVCKQTGWLEIAGAGMVHPVVLRNGGYDPDEWNGFAFGMGVERPAMLHHGIEDIRHFYNNDLRFLRQF